MRYRRQFAKIVWLSRPYWQAAIHVIISTLILFFVNFFLVNKEIMRFEWIFLLLGGLTGGLMVFGREIRIFCMVAKKRILGYNLGGSGGFFV
jgi:hypothetical protein